MLVKLIEIYKKDSYTSAEKVKFSLRETYINPDHVIYMREDNSTPSVLRETSSLSNIDERQEFTTVCINTGHSGMKLNIVGSLSTIQEKLCKKREILKG